MASNDRLTASMRRKNMLRRSKTSEDPMQSDHVDSRNVPSNRFLSQSLTDLLTCPICLEQLRRPTMLPCQHTFCLPCLQNYVRDNAHVITCPTCRKDVQVPSKGLSALPTNIALQTFIETLTTKQEPAATGVTAAQRTASAGETPRCRRCSVNAATTAPCSHCNQVFCKSCNVVHENELRTKWGALVDDLSAQDQRLSLLTEDYKARSDKLEHKIGLAAAIRVQKVLENQERLVLELTNWRREEELRLVSIRQKYIEIMACAPKSANTPWPKEEIFDKAAVVLDEAQQLGLSRLTFDEEEFCLTHQTSELDPRSATLPTARTKQSEKRVNFHDSSVEDEAPLVPQQSTDPSEGSGRKIDTPSTSDERSLLYRCKKNARVRVTSTVLQRPAGLAVSPWTGEIYVISTESHLVYVLDRSGKITKSMGSAYRRRRQADVQQSNGGAPTNGQFLCPAGIAFSTAAEEIYVTDKWMNCIHVFDKEGRYLRQMGVKGTSPGQFQAPEGLAVDARGFIYVADTCNDRVQVLDRDGVFVREIGRVALLTLADGRTQQKPEFSEPTGVAVSASGDRVAVCDVGNCRVKVFGPNGERLLAIGFRGTQRGHFQQPECIAMDEKGFILVGDNGNGRIQIFRPNGQFVTTFGTKGTGAGQFNWISGLALTDEMEIVATDFKNHCLQIF